MVMRRAHRPLTESETVPMDATSLQDKAGNVHICNKTVLPAILNSSRSMGTNLKCCCKCLRTGNNQ